MFKQSESSLSTDRFELNTLYSLINIEHIPKKNCQLAGDYKEQGLKWKFSMTKETLKMSENRRSFHSTYKVLNLQK